jgi:hypothetical protein
MMCQPIVSCSFRKGLTGFAAILALGGGACGRPARAPDRGPEHFTVLVDVSSSIGESDVPRWGRQLGQRLAEMRAGDGLTMLPIGRRSAEAAPLLELQLRVATRQMGRTKVLEAQKAAANAHRQVQERFAAALAHPTSTGTDIFGALGRVPARTRQLIIFSDMLHSDPRFDMEKLRLPPDQLPKVVERLVEQGRLKADSLAGVQVWIHLTALSIDERKRPIMDRAVLHAFWVAVFEKLGATVEYFDNGDGLASNG